MGGNSHPAKEPAAARRNEKPMGARCGQCVLVSPGNRDRIAAGGSCEFPIELKRPSEGVVRQVREETSRKGFLGAGSGLFDR